MAAERGDGNVELQDSRPRGWWWADNAVFAHAAAIGPSGLAVYCALCRYAGEDRRAWPSLRTLGRLLGLSTNTVAAALDRLAERGLITITPRERRASCVYTLCDVATAEVSQKLRHGVSKTETPPPARGVSKTETEQEEKKKQEEAKSRRTTQECSTTAPVTPSRQSVPASRPASEPKPLRQRKPVDSAAFTAFWTAYPRKAAKQAALRAWQALRPSAALQARILADVTQRSRSPDWQRDGGQFVPYPGTYLRGRRWEDELAPAATNGSRYAAL